MWYSYCWSILVHTEVLINKYTWCFISWSSAYLPRLPDIGRTVFCFGELHDCVDKTEFLYASVSDINQSNNCLDSDICIWKVLMVRSKGERNLLCQFQYRMHWPAYWHVEVTCNGSLLSVYSCGIMMLSNDGCDLCFCRLNHMALVP